MKNSLPKSKLILSSCAAAALFCAGCATTPPDETSTKERGEAVYVTGSNIPRHHVGEAYGVSTVTREQLDREGPVLTPQMPMPMPGGSH